MKQVRLSLMMLILMMPLTAIAHDFEKNGIYYDIMEDGISVAVSKAPYSQNYEGDIVIPESVLYDGKEYVVKSIQQRAFHQCSITSLKVPTTIREIGEYAFYDCDSLKTVDIGDLSNWCTIDFQGNDWFANPISRYQLEHLLVNGKEITDLVIPDDVTEISRNAFCWCPPIHSLEIPGTVKVIGEDAFSRSYKITKLILHEGIEEIKQGGVANLGTITITLPRSIKRLGKNALNYENTESHLRNVCLLNPNPDEIVLEDEPGLESSFGIVPMVGVPFGAMDAYSLHKYWGQFTLMEGLTEEDFNNVVRLDFFYSDETRVKKDTRGYFAPKLHGYPGYQGEGKLTCDFALGLYQDGQQKAVSKHFWNNWTFVDWKTCNFSTKSGIYIDNIPDGNYQMRMLYRIGDEEWKPMVNSENVYIDITVKGDEMMLNNRYLNGADLRLESFDINGMPKMGHDLTVSAKVTNTGIKRKGTFFLHVNDTVRGYLPVDIKTDETSTLTFLDGWSTCILALNKPDTHKIEIVDGEGNVVAQKQLVIPEPEKNNLLLNGIEIEGQHGHLVASRDNFIMTVKVKNVGEIPYTDELKCVVRQLIGIYEDGDTLISQNGVMYHSIDVPVNELGECTFEVIDYDAFNREGKRPNMNWYWNTYSFFEIYYYSEGTEVLLTKTPVYKWINPEDYEGKIYVEPVGFSREYGDENPTSIAYSVYGGELNGTPHIYSETSNETPVGHYYIKCEKGSVANDNVVFSEAAVMAVRKAPLVVTALSCSRQLQQDNPQFELSYSGFKNGETEDVLIAKPVATTVANISSATGEYDIIVSGGEARNYEFTYVSGTLTIIEESGIAEIIASGLFDVYNLEGQLVVKKATQLQGLPRGTYIIRPVNSRMSGTNVRKMTIK